MTSRRPGLPTGTVPRSPELQILLASLRELGALLPALAADVAPAGRTEVLRSFIEDYEERRRVVLPFDVLALVALRIPLLVRATGLSPEGLARAETFDASAIAKGWVPIAWFDADAPSPTYVPSATGYLGSPVALCVSRGARERGGDPEVATYADGHEGSMEPVKLSALLEERLARRFGRDAEESKRWAEARRRARSEESLAEETAGSLVDEAPADAAAIRCSHPKLGTGTIVRLVEGGKAEVAFDSGERRLLLRSFLREG